MKKPLRYTIRITEINVKLPKGARSLRHTATENMQPTPVTARNQKTRATHHPAQVYTLSNSRVTRTPLCDCCIKKKCAMKRTIFFCLLYFYLLFYERSVETPPHVFGVGQWIDGSMVAFLNYHYNYSLLIHTHTTTCRQTKQSVVKRAHSQYICTSYLG